ncbi:HD domain-containing protein [uncultured Draconibacterium sp.]|uniref:deoxyguanosinetriphosphate triphosphohydrolase family protein n=1 Tax=uncultured Draconibacterium sp. TaxID=1573823 RepID=UPI002AA71AF2|nr:HD domain-containing protein [uncultured Draconibacterium sp.]
MSKNNIEKKYLEERTTPKEEDIRGCYYRDQTAIIHSRPFRRLKHKTQVFFSPDDDHVCTRIEHVLHVASIAATICRGLKSKKDSEWELDEDLAYSIGLGHDLGHTPFGHSGESQLSYILENGRFMHELNSYRVVEKLANQGKGLNLTYAVKDGIICHNGEKFEQSIKPDFTVKELAKINNRKNTPSTWEGCIVRFSDKIAYLGRDIEDALIANLISEESIPKSIQSQIGSSNGEIINYLVLDLIENTTEKEISFSKECHELILELKEFNTNSIYQHPRIKKYENYCKNIISTLYDYLLKMYCSFHWDLEWYMKEDNLDVDIFFGNYLKGMNGFYTNEKNTNEWTEGQLGQQIVLDYISGMTDKFAIDCMREISLPKPIEFKPKLKM